MDMQKLKIVAEVLLYISLILLASIIFAFLTGVI